MYCVNCGVKLADTEKRCPLCDTVVYHPEVKQENRIPLYPPNKMPQQKSNAKGISGVVLMLFMLPMLVCFAADFQLDGSIEWFGYVAGALTLIYMTVAFPFWFQNPNPVIFVPCDFAVAVLYLLFINWATGGNWFLSFALPVTGGVAIICCAVVTLWRYLRKGKLYVLGGAFIALGALAVLLEFLMDLTFGLSMIWWSVYPLIALGLVGGLLIYLAANSAAREMMERKLFF